ncbi:MAG TPA: Ku protein [Candidatus Limnocylindrales bacterium]|nr:Ku protein [Candidatus Limnocylindrales bacterium]
MARAMWKGAIQFGLVTIPVKLYLATESNYNVRFHMLHEKDLSRIQMKVWCPVDEEVISRSETVKGYEYAPDQYVVITDEDLQKVPLKTVRTIEIEQFVPREGDESDDTRFVKQAYYIEPDKIARKAFYLLRQVLEDRNLSAICKVVIKDREALGAIDPFGNTMLLSTLHWPDEIRSTKELDLPAEVPEFKPAEMKMAEQLVSAMTGDFDASQYRDEYREALMQVIEAKIEGRETVAPEEPEETNLVDLMAALQASVEQAKKARAAGGGEPVSVEEAKRKRAARTEKPAEKKESAATAKRAGKAARAEEAAAEEPAAAEHEERPARRRKSA